MLEILVRAPRALEIRQGAMPAPGPGEVVLRVSRGGICGSDIHILHGSNPFAVYPRVIGHEFAGRVTALGEGVSGLALGDHVVVDPVVWCGQCYPCRVGRSNVCANLEVMGVHRDGGFRDYVAVPARNAVPVPADMPLGLAALAEPFSIAANVLDRTGCGPQDIVLIYGAGTVGVTVLQVAKLFGARCIVADIDEARLERALRFGADRVIHSARDRVPDAVRAENDGLGPTLVIDGAGIPALLDARGNPWLRLLRREVEELVRSRQGEQYLRERQARTELARINRELKQLRPQLAALEERRAALLSDLGER